MYECRNETCSNPILLGKKYCSQRCFYSSKRKNYRSKWERGEPINDRSPQGIDPFMCGVISGFTAGEGSFCFHVGKSNTHKTGFQVNPIFSIKLKCLDYLILEEIKNTLGCGSVSINKDAASFVVRKLEDHLEIIIPFFDNYPILNVKKTDYEYYKLICFKLAKGEGKYKEGIKRILSIRDVLNGGGHKTRRKINLN